MRANIPKLPMGAVKIFPDMSDADVRAWNRTEAYRMREELRKKGCDILAWEKGVEMDQEGNVSFAAWDGGRRK